MLIASNIDVEASWQTLEDEAGYQQQHAGLRVWKSVDDLARYRMAIETTRPEVLVETGTRWGGFAAWVADEYGIPVITVDVERTEGRPDAWPRVRYVLGDSAAAETVAQVHELVAGRRAMVSLDSDHTAPHVEREIAAYAPMVAVGCYLVVEDGLADLLTPARARRLGRAIPERGGPMRAIRRQLFRRPGWRRGYLVENLSAISHSPAGWWIRTDS